MPFSNVVSLAISNVLSLLVSFVVTCVLYIVCASNRLVLGENFY